MSFPIPFKIDLGDGEHVWFNASAIVIVDRPNEDELIELLDNGNPVNVEDWTEVETSNGENRVIEYPLDKFIEEWQKAIFNAMGDKALLNT